MMSTGVFSLLLLAAFVVCGRSLRYNDDYDAAFSLDQLSEENESQQKFLENNIFNGTDPGYLCDDPYTALCGREIRNHQRPAHLRQAYPSIRNHVINILSQPIAHNELMSLSVEKTLYQKCINLGFRNDNENVHATNAFLKLLSDKILDETDTWKNVDNQLNLRGFDFTFFDIGVERDPENPKQNVIVIEPPSQSKIQGLYELIMIVFQEGNPQHISKSYADKLFNPFSLQPDVHNFIRSWTEIFSRSSTQRKQEKMSLKKWSELYNSQTDKQVGQINWQKLIRQNFARVNIDIDGSERIIIRNKDYFLSLADILGNTPNEVIVNAIKTKIVLDNIRYIDYKYADELKHRKRQLFCYADTKLYGASFRILRDLKKEDPKNGPIYEILHTVLHNIADVLQFAIQDAKELTSNEKTYLRAQVKLITSNGIKHNKYRKIVDKYYENYELSLSYFESILNYRKMLKEKELSSLTIYSEHLNELEPFSVIDLAKPRNRFILNVLSNSFLLSRLPIPSGLQKEVHYGIYGVKIASFLYGLLNENKFDTVNLTGRVDWFAHPQYPAKSLQCFVGEDIRSYGWGLAAETVTQIFGIHIAYQAMLKDYTESKIKRQGEYLITSADMEMIPIEADQLFFMAYGKYHCDLGQTALRTILLNLEEYNSAFECEALHGNFKPQCPLNGFQIQRKRYFLNQPF